MERHLITTFPIFGREPILRRMPDGTLVCLFLSGGPCEPHNDNVVMISHSPDDGETWSEPEVLFSHHFRACWATELFCDGERPYAVVHTYNADCIYRELQTFRSFTDDNGKTWSEPVSFKGSINGCSIRQGITMSNGEILFPLYWQEVRSGFDWEKPNEWSSQWYEKWCFVSGVGISSDDEMFTRYGYFASDSLLWEPNAVETDPGHIILYCRSTEHFLFRTESRDYGRTWSRLGKTDIPDPGSKISLIKIRGKVFLFSNLDQTERINLSVSVSDDGIRFSKLFNIESADRNFFYPHAYADEVKETLYLAYENTKQHYLMKIPYAELGV